MGGRVIRRADRATGRWQLAAAPLGVLSPLALVAVFALEIVTDQVGWDTSDIANSVTFVAFALAFTAVGVWSRAASRAIRWDGCSSALARDEALGDRRLRLRVPRLLRHHGRLPLGTVAVLLSQAWASRSCCCR